MNDNTKGMFGFLAGAAIGAALGILFAPASGKETRERIIRKARDSKDEFDETVDDAHEQWRKAKGKAEDTVNMTRDEVTDFIRFLFDEGKDLKDRLTKDVKDSAERTAHKAEKAADKVRDSVS